MTEDEEVNQTLTFLILVEGPAVHPVARDGDLSRAAMVIAPKEPRERTREFIGSIQVPLHEFDVSTRLDVGVLRGRLEG